MAIFLTFLALIPFYLLGAFPSGYLIAKRHQIDITSQGSGNVGATNLARVLGVKAGLTTLLLDFSKGFLASCLAYYLTSRNLNFSAYAGFAAILGHTISIPSKLPAGKGVATTAGAFLFLAPQALFCSLLIFILVFSWQRIVSLASISAVLALSLLILLTNQTNALIYTSALTTLVVCFKHRANLERFIKGKEEKFKFKMD